MFNHVNNRYLFTSGIASLLFFIITFLLFAFAIIGTKKVKNFALKKDIYVSINLDTVNLPKKTVKKEQPVKKSKQKKLKPINNESAAIAIKNKEVDISSLFSNVQAKKVILKKSKPKQRTLNRNFLNSLTKNTQTLQKSEEELISKKVEKIKLSKDKITMVNASASTGKNVNEYLAKIQAFIYENFFPPANSQGSSVKVRIKLDSNSKMSEFKILVTSNNDFLNQEVENLRNVLKSSSFPENPEHKSMLVDIILTAKE